MCSITLYAEFKEKSIGTIDAIRALDEAYVGDLLTAKSYTVDYLTKTRKTNKGEKEQHYIKNHHPAIISREDFDRTQQILAERRRS